MRRACTSSLRARPPPTWVCVRDRNLDKWLVRNNYSSQAIVRVDKMVKEEIGERWRCAILGRHLASFK